MEGEKMDEAILYAIWRGGCREANSPPHWDQTPDWLKELWSIRHATPQIAKALDAYRAYVDTSDLEIQEAATTREALLAKAREIDPYDGNTPTAAAYDYIT